MVDGETTWPVRDYMIFSVTTSLNASSLYPSTLPVPVFQILNLIFRKRWLRRPVPGNDQADKAPSLLKRSGPWSLACFIFHVIISQYHVSFARIAAEVFEHGKVFVVKDSVWGTMAGDDGRGEGM